MFYLSNIDRSKYDINKTTKIKLIIIDSLRNKEEHIIELHKKSDKEINLGHMDALAMKIIEKDINLKAHFHILNDH